MANMDTATRAAVNAAASKAADIAVRRTFLTLGVDVSTPHEVRELQQDFALLRSTRLARGGRGKYVLVVFSTLMTIIGAAVTMTVQHLFGGPHP